MTSSEYTAFEDADTVESVRPVSTGGGWSDLFRVLRDDHREASTLLAQVCAGSVAERRARWRRAAQALGTHAEAETEEVYRRLLGVDRMADEAGRALRDHDEIAERIRALDDVDPGGAGFADHLGELAALVRRHVEEEERTLLPLAEQVLEANELDELTARYRDRKRRLEA